MTYAHDTHPRHITVNIRCPYCGANAIVKTEHQAKPTATAFYCGLPPDAPRETDADFLLAVAGWLDHVDEATDAELKDHGVDHEVGRAVQDRLREVADRIA